MAQMLSSDWDSIRLVVFDVDGTLYRQRPLRLRMACDMLIHVAAKRDTTALRVIHHYRQIRERLGDDEVIGFNHELIKQTAHAAATTPEAVQDIVADWIETKPLPYLSSCLYDGVPELLAGLRRKRIAVGIFSDYPARAKIGALGLSADHIVAACDDGVGVLKPHPKGLEMIIAAAGVGARQTVMIGDRAERDGLAAQRAGVRALLRAQKPLKDWTTFSSYRDPIFTPILSS